MNRLIAVALSITLLPLGASAATPPKMHGMKIESEAQLQREHGGRLEKLGPGIYQVISGELAGKTITIGEAGLAYDLSRLRAKIAQSGGQDRQLAKQLRTLESVQKHMGDGKRLSQQISPLAYGNATLYCYSNGNPLSAGEKGGQITYGYADVQARADFIEPIGLGYYAFAGAIASGYVDLPWNPNPTISVVAETWALNHQNNQFSYGVDNGISSAYASAFINSGPTFSHSLSADAAVYGTGQCWGYVAVSDYFAY